MVRDLAIPKNNQSNNHGLPAWPLRSRYQRPRQGGSTEKTLAIVTITCDLSAKLFNAPPLSPSTRHE